VNLEWGKVVKNINWTIVANLANFALLLYLLKRLLFKPALEYIDRRREQIAARMESARVSEGKAAALIAEQEATLQAAHAQARRTVEEATARAEGMISAAKGDAKQEASRILSDGRRQIEQERTEMEADLRRAYAEIAVLGASRVLDREVKIEDHRRLLDELLQGIDDEALRMRQ
jgi:F-type H+-transporting ATPase subunit b